MKAKIQKLNTYENLGKKREKVSEKFAAQYSVIDPADGSQIVIVRLYVTGTTHHVCAWFHGNVDHGSGYGRAGGYGYCKTSAAVGEALHAAGVELSEPISGRGISMVRDALMAVGKKLTGKRKLFFHTAYA